MVTFSAGVCVPLLTNELGQFILMFKCAIELLNTFCLICSAFPTSWVHRLLYSFKPHPPFESECIISLGGGNGLVDGLRGGGGKMVGGYVLHCCNKHTQFTVLQFFVFCCYGDVSMVFCVQRG